MRVLAYILILLLTASNAFAQGSRQIQSSDVTGALGYTPLRSIGAMTGPDILCGTGIICSLNTISATATVGGSSGQIQYNNAGVFGGFTLSGDATVNTSTGAMTLATVNANVGSFGSATQCTAFTTNAKGLITAASQITCTPDIASVTGLGTGVATALVINVGTAGSFITNGGAAGTPSSITLTSGTGLPISTGLTGAGTGVITALGVNVGTAGSVVVNGGALGTPSSGVATNLTGTASGLTAGNVTTNANLTGAVTSVGNASSLGSFTSANLRGALTDESGTGSAYFQGGDIGTPSAGVATNLTALNASQLTSGTVPAARTNGHQNGTATNDNAAAGEIGEFITATQVMASGISLTSTTAANIISISLTAGDWDVFGVAQYQPAGTTVVNYNRVAITTTSATFPSGDSGAIGAIAFGGGKTGGNNDWITTPSVRISVNSTTTVYLVAFSSFTTSTNTVGGTISARRRR